MFESRGDTHSVSHFNAASLLASNMDRGDGRGVLAERGAPSDRKARVDCA